MAVNERLAQRNYQQHRQLILDFMRYNILFYLLITHTLHIIEKWLYWYKHVHLLCKLKVVLKFNYNVPILSNEVINRQNSLCSYQSFQHSNLLGAQVGKGNKVVQRETSNTSTQMYMYICKHPIKLRKMSRIL